MLSSMANVVSGLDVAAVSDSDVSSIINNVQSATDALLAVQQQQQQLQSDVDIKTSKEVVTQQLAVQLQSDGGNYDVISSGGGVIVTSQQVVTKQLDCDVSDVKSSSQKQLHVVTPIAIVTSQSQTGIEMTSSTSAHQVVEMVNSEEVVNETEGMEEEGISVVKQES